MVSTSNLEPLSTTKESPNWLEMSHELMANILKRLGDAEILNIAVKVCTTWWRICKDAAMWKVISMHKQVGARNADYDLELLTKHVVHLSCGELIDISLEWFGSDDLLDYIVLRSSKLKNLCLTDCYAITNSGLNRALKRVPQLEKLDICYTSWMVSLCEDMVSNFPQIIKSFKLDKPCTIEGPNDDDALGNLVKVYAQKNPVDKKLQRLNRLLYD